MFEKTKGIVLHQIKFDDKKRIITIYTEKFGRTSFVVSSSKKLNVNLFRPFNILEINLSKKGNSNFYRIAEVSPFVNYKSIPYNIEKSSIALFLSEILYKILTEESPNKDLFEFIEYSISILDNLDENIASFHLIFLLKITRYFGFYPYENYSENKTIFDMIDGTFVSKIPAHKNYLATKQSGNFWNLINLEYNTKINISRIDKNELLKNVIDYFKIHHESLGEIKSLEVLKEVFI